MPKFRPARVVVIDDNRDDLVLMRLALRRAGLALDFEAFRTGDAFLSAMAARGEAGAAPPDLALVDLNLPMTRGADVIRRTRTAPWGRAMTLGVCSGSTDPADRAECAAAGAAFFVSKPVTGETIAAIARAAPAFDLGPDGGGRLTLRVAATGDAGDPAP
jgi:CheY-like chemotaxis protein